MNIKEIKKDLKLLNDKTPNGINDIAEITIAFFQLHKQLLEGGDKILKDKYTLSRSEIDVMSALYYSGGDECILSPTNLYDRLLFSSGGMTKILNRLESKAYILRLENSLDKRSMLVQLNETGKRVCEDVIKDILLYEESCFKNLNKKDKDVFKSLLYKIAEVK
jgi:DNA-binding MarR family transcriptional regulator